MEGTARPESQGELRDSGPGCGARGRRRGLAEQRADAPSQPTPHQAPPVRRAPEGPEGTAVLRDAPSEARGADGSRAGRHPRAHTAARPHSRALRHSDHQRDIKQHPRVRPQRTHTNTTRARQSRPQTHTTRARQSRPRAHTPLGHDKAARPHRGRAAVAVALGFEPRVAVTPHSISSAAPSAARTRYLTRILYYTDPRATQIDRAGWEQGHTTPRRADLALTNKHAHPWAQLQ